MRLPVLSIIFLFVFTFLIDLYIFFDIKSLSKKKDWKWIYAGTSILCWSLLIIAISLPRRAVNSDLQPIMWLLYSFLSIYIAKVVYCIFSLLGRLLEWPFKKRLYPFKWIGLVLGLGACAAMWIGVGYNRKHIVRENVIVESPKLPKAFDGYKIVQISDLHVGSWGNDTTFISNLVDSVNNLKPDLIVFTGDIVNRQTSEIEPFLSSLSRLKAKDGVYSILGNHDYGDYADWNSPLERDQNNRLLADYQRKIGWHLLNNEKVVLSQNNDSIILIGVENWGDPPFPVYGDLNKAISPSKDSVINQNDNNFKILLSHNPEHWNREVSKSTNIDLTLSGHTHAMQMILKVGDWKWSPVKYRYEQWGGLYERNNINGEKTRLYVNIGAGEVGMPARLFSAFPEITLITLKKK